MLAATWPFSELPRSLLGAIADRYGTRVAAIKRANGLDSSLIHPDLELTIPLSEIGQGTRPGPEPRRPRPAARSGGDRVRCSDRRQRQ